MALERKEDWAGRLMRFLDERRLVPFVWGGNDCCLFAADAVMAMTGIDPAKPFRGKYKTKERAYVLLKKFSNGGGVEEALAKTAAEIGCEELPNPNFMQRGDVALVDSELGPALAVCSGRSLMIVQEDGMHPLTLSAARRAWRVG